MKVLTVYAHPDPHSFCHGVLERFTAGLREAGHESLSGSRTWTCG